MRFSLLPSIQSVDSSTDVAVVIDVLRATSVMTTALANGAKQIITCQSIDEAFAMAESADPNPEPNSKPLLCGERHCKPIDGFDLGNSPAEYARDVVQDRTLVLTTTNGTRAIAAANPAKRMIVASFLNFAAVVEFLKNADSVHLVCAGTNGEITAEDVLLAGAIGHELLQTRPNDELESDDAILAVELWRSWLGKNEPSDAWLSQRLMQTQGGKNLVDVGFESDLALCGQINSLNVVPLRTGDQPNTFALTAKL